MISFKAVVLASLVAPLAGSVDRNVQLSGIEENQVCRSPRGERG